MTAVDLDHDSLDAQFHHKRIEVERYGLAWWTTDADVRARCAREPALLTRLRSKLSAGHVVQTIDVYKGDAAIWSTPRPSIHSQIVSQLMPQIRAVSRARRPPAFFLFGGPGSGKTTALRPLITQKGMICPTPLDADDVRVLLPEYSGGMGSEVVQEECAYVTYGELRSSILTGTPHPDGICIDQIGSPEHAIDDLLHVTDAGYAAYALLADCPTPTAVKRVMQRTILTGRYVSLDYVESVGNRPHQALRTLVEAAESGSIELAGWGHFDTSNQDPGVPPTVLDGDGTFGKSGGHAVKLAL